MSERYASYWNAFLFHMHTLFFGATGSGWGEGAGRGINISPKITKFPLTDGFRISPGRNFWGGCANSLIHKAASSLVTGRSLQNGKMSMENRCTERPPDPVLYGSRLSGGFVNSAVTCYFTKFMTRMHSSRMLTPPAHWPYLGGGVHGGKSENRCRHCSLFWVSFSVLSFKNYYFSPLKGSTHWCLC